MYKPRITQRFGLSEDETLGGALYALQGHSQGNSKDTIKNGVKRIFDNQK